MMLVVVSPAAVSRVQAQSQDVPPVDIKSSGFKLVVCDGPEGLRPPGDLSYRACDFRGLMIQAQYLINVMIVLGVVAAILGFAWGGYLYITGTQGNIKKAKEIFPKLGIGFILMLTAWFIVYQILSWLTGNSSYLSG